MISGSKESYHHGSEAGREATCKAGWVWFADATRTRVAQPDSKKNKAMPTRHSWVIGQRRTTGSTLGSVAIVRNSARHRASACGVCLRIRGVEQTFDFPRVLQRCNLTIRPPAESWGVARG